MFQLLDLARPEDADHDRGELVGLRRGVVQQLDIDDFLVRLGLPLLSVDTSLIMAIKSVDRFVVMRATSATARGGTGCCGIEARS